MVMDVIMKTDNHDWPIFLEDEPHKKEVGEGEEEGDETAED